MSRKVVLVMRLRMMVLVVMVVLFLPLRFLDSPALRGQTR